MGASGAQGTGYTIGQSIRFEDGGSPYLNRSFSGAGNKKTATMSCWLKMGNIGTNKGIFTFINDKPLELDSNNNLKVHTHGSNRLITDREFRDPAAWYHIVLSIDSTEAVANERVRLYVNGERETSFSTESYPSEDADGTWWASNYFQIGRTYGTSNYMDGYLAEIHYLDGYAYGPEYFGEFDSNGIWIPKEYTDSYGTNGFKIDGRDSSDLGDDESGNGNDFTLNGMAAHDYSLDSPTNNFCIMSPIDKAYNSVSEGNLKTTGGTNNVGGRGSMGFSSGKWYWEVLVNTQADGYGGSGVVYPNYEFGGNNYVGGGGDPGGGASHNRERWYTQSTSYTAYGSQFASGDILQYALDRDNNKIYWGVNGTYRNSGNPAAGSGAVASGLTHYDDGTWMPYANHGSNAGASVATFNFGQDGTFAGVKTAQGNSDGNDIGNFYYSVPSGFLALCSSNLGS